MKIMKPFLKTVAQKRIKIGVACLIIGLAGLAPSVYYRWIAPVNQPAIPTAVAPINQQLAMAGPREQIIKGTPVHLDIPSLQLSLVVADGNFNQNTGQWTLSLDKAHFANISAPVNTKMGNTLIYGHYRPEVFASLHRIKPDSEAIVTTDNGYRFIYHLQAIHETSPSDTSLFAYTGPPQLTIQTCSGAFFQNRQLFTFSFVRYEKKSQNA